MKRLLISIMLFFIFSSGASANDSTARIAAGGITFTKNTEIRILEESLHISTKAVRVKYRLFNESDKDIHTTVAFPMPVYGWNPGFSSSDNEGPITTFIVLINGQRVSTTTHRKAVIGNQDVTEKLRKLGLSDKQIFDTFGGIRVDGMEFKNDLTAHQNLAIKQLGKTNDQYQYKQWQIASTLLWDQTFPAGKEVIVEHTYEPFVGEVYGVADIPTAPEKPNSPKESCIDEGTERALRNRIKNEKAKGAENIIVWLKHVEYILATGRNWKGPIGEFKLFIEKDTPDHIISVCFPGKPKRINPNVYEFVQKNYIPQDTLVVYFYNLTSEQRKGK